MVDEAIERAVWTDADFETMGWHDAVVHAIGFQNDDDSARLQLTFLASGYRQHIRQQPIHVVDAQRLTEAQRGGISFDQPRD